MKLRVGRIAALAVALCIAVVAAAVLRPKPGLLLPDGSSLTLEKTGYGQTRHRLVHGNFLERALYGWVPTSWLDFCLYTPSQKSAPVRKAIAMRAMKHIAITHTTTNDLVLWLTQRGAIGLSGGVRVLPVDENGNAWGTAPPPVFAFTGTAGAAANVQDRIFNATLPVFPRRGRSVRLRVFVQRGGLWEPAGEFSVPNPAFREYPRWSMSSGPPTVTRDGYEFTLSQLLNGVDQRRPPRLTSEGEMGTLRAEFQVARGGQSSSAWSVEGLEIEDATGNVWRAAAHHSGDQAISFRERRLPTNEVLKVRGTFVRRHDFDAGALWKVSQVPLPPLAGFLLFTNYATNFNGTGFSLVGISGGGAQIPGSGIGSSLPLLHFRITPPLEQKEWRVGVLSVTDANGVTMTPPPSHRPIMGANLAYNFHYGPGTTNANFVFALHKPITVEFMTRAGLP